MTHRWQEDPDELAGRLDPSDASLDARLKIALATKPSVAIAEGFAAATAARATQSQQESTGKQLLPRPGIGWGLTATVGGLALLLALMIRYALFAPSVIATVAETTFCVEFLMLLLGFLHFRRSLL